MITLQTIERKALQKAEPESMPARWDQREGVSLGRFEGYDLWLLDGLAQGIVARYGNGPGDHVWQSLLAVACSESPSPNMVALREGLRRAFAFGHLDITRGDA